MPLRFNPFTSNLDIVGVGIQGPTRSTDKAITRWNGTTGSLVQDSPRTNVQDSGAIVGQGHISIRNVLGTVVVDSGESWIAPSLVLEPGSLIVLNADSELIII